jgi:hypothetical protein
MRWRAELASHVSFGTVRIRSYADSTRSRAVRARIRQVLPVAYRYLRGGRSSGATPCRPHLCPSARTCMMMRRAICRSGEAMSDVLRIAASEFVVGRPFVHPRCRVPSQRTASHRYSAGQELCTQFRGRCRARTLCALLSCSNREWSGKLSAVPRDSPTRRHWRPNRLAFLRYVVDPPSGYVGRLLYMVLIESPNLRGRGAVERR